MIKHVVFMKLRADVTASQVEAMVAALNSAPLEATLVKNWSWGKNVNARCPDNHYAVVCDFEDLAALEAYKSLSFHDHIRPILESSSVVDYEFWNK